MTQQGLDLFWKILSNYGVPLALLMIAIAVGYKMSKKAVEYWLHRDEKYEKKQEEFIDYLKNAAKEQNEIIRQHTEMSRKMIIVWEELVDLLKSKK